MRFDQHGRMYGYLASIPVYVILSEFATLRGVAVAAREKLDVSQPDFSRTQATASAVTYNTSVLQFNDPIDALQGRQPVSDGDHGAPPHQLFERLTDRGFPDAESRADVTSSSSKIGASFRKALAMAIRRRYPPDSLTPRVPTMVANPAGRCSMKSHCAALAAART